MCENERDNECERERINVRESEREIEIGMKNPLDGRHKLKN